MMVSEEEDGGVSTKQGRARTNAWSVQTWQERAFFNNFHRAFLQQG